MGFVRLLIWGYRRKETSDVELLAEKASLEVGLEDLHDRDEALHLVETAAEIGLSGPGSLQTRLRVGQAEPQVFHHGGVGGRRTSPGGGNIFL